MLTLRKAAWILIAAGVLLTIGSRVIELPPARLVALLVGTLHVVVGASCLALSKGRSAGWGALGAMGILGATVVAFIPVRERTSVPVPFALLVVPALFAATFSLCLTAVWISGGSLAASLYSARQESLWRDHLGTPAKQTEALRSPRIFELARSVVARDGNGASKELGDFRRALLASRTEIQLAEQASNLVSAKRAELDATALLLSRARHWDEADSKSIRAVRDLHTTFLASSVVAARGGDPATAERHLQAAEELTRFMIASSDTLAVLAGSAAENGNAAVARRFSQRSTSLVDRTTVRRFLRDEVSSTVTAMRPLKDDQGNSAFPLLARPLVRFWIADYQRAWRERLAELGTSCRDGVSEPRFARGNRMGSYAAPDPRTTDRLYLAMLARELTGMVHGVRRTKGALPRVGIRSSVCTDVIWIVEKNDSGFTVSIDRPFVLHGSKPPEVALSYSEGATVAGR